MYKAKIYLHDKLEDVKYTQKSAWERVLALRKKYGYYAVNFKEEIINQK